MGKDSSDVGKEMPQDSEKSGSLLDKSEDAKTSHQPPSVEDQKPTDDEKKAVKKDKGRDQSVEPDVRAPGNGSGPSSRSGSLDDASMQIQRTTPTQSGAFGLNFGRPFFL
ncbi:hypothetical protein AYO20_08418 [Fonsecaea nubica]|uniref:Uncharacterized protein n=1 Tax=Fonsecaea nubica TaxID=856822 RepID=A0A178CNL7_9EURO|nr:hypothetical protein AYO20_08418 [Fonsecaea nubica]OAL31087.1 hypothetical protein AYO20_08418 [Fonsecaea nubica]